MIRTAIISLAADGQHESEALQALRSVMSKGNFTEVDYIKLELSQAVLRSKIRMIADTETADLVLTLGGIGLDIQDRVPEATAEMIEREVSGIADLIRLILIKKTRHAALYRNIAGVRKCTLIVNLPANPEEAKLACEAIVSILPKAIESIKYDALY